MPLSESSPPSYWNQLGGGFSHMPPAETKSFYGNHPPGPYRSKLTVESPRNQGQSQHMHRYADGFPSFPIRTQKRSLPKIILLSRDPAASSEGDRSSSISSHLYLLIHLYACKSPPQGWKLRQLAIWGIVLSPGGQDLLPGCLGTLHVMQ